MLANMDQAPSWSAYDRDPARFVSQYETLSFDQIHGHWLHHLPVGRRALDVGAGSGRDAAALAERGFEVLAVEPAEGMRARAHRLHPDPRIRWIGDHLPELTEVGDQTFDVVLLAGVWMHLPPPVADRAFARLAPLVAEDGVMVISVRGGGVDAARGMRPIPATEVADLARANGRREVEVIEAADLLGRDEIRWRTHVIR